MIVIMASAAANSALGTEVLAVQRLFYDIDPNPGASIFLLFSSQLIGYGIGGLMRRKFLEFIAHQTLTLPPAILLYPSKMLYPGVLPLISMFDAFFKDSSNSRKKLRLFYVAFFLYVALWRFSSGTVLILHRIASSSGRYSPNGCSPYSPVSRYSVSQTPRVKTSLVCLVDPTEMRGWACCQSALTGNISAAE